MDAEQLEATGGVFPALGVAIASLDDDALSNVTAAKGNGGAILDVEPERIFYAVGDGLPLSYLRGYRDSVSHLLQQAAVGTALEDEVDAAVTFVDDAQSTWGLKATNVVNSRFNGRGIKVAVLDTGMDLKHPDFKGRSFTSQSFIPGQTPQDGHGHGTHCIGTSCGSKDINGRRYGIASEASIFVGKVLSNGGSGSTGGIIAGIEWAIDNGCQVISMSLGNRVPTPSTAYEVVGQRALHRGALIVAAAGNHGPATVGQPANSPSFMAVGALNNSLQVPTFSCPSGTAVGANVDIAGPGVAVYSSVPMPKRYDSFRGTSMATPHVAGIAAQLAQASSQGARGWHLWALLSAFASRLPLPSTEVGAGLVQAPV
jgi:subtilisin family serine protease